MTIIYPIEVNIISITFVTFLSPTFNKKERYGLIISLIANTSGEK